MRTLLSIVFILLFSFTVLADKDGDGFRISPHPVKDQGTFHFENPDGLTYTFTVFDLVGNQVLVKKGISSNQFGINATNLKNGFYFFKLTNKDGVALNGRFLVSH